jgi:copper transport protein
LLAPAVASAHAELESSTPAANASLKTAPTEVSMTFTEPVDPSSASVELLGENQQPIPGVGQPQTSDDAKTLTVGLPDLDAGIYTVSWRVTSASDGHVTAGIFAFLVDPTGTVPAPTTSESSSSPSADAGTIAARWFALIAGLALFGIAVFWLASARPTVAALGAPEVGGTAIWVALAVSAALAFAGLAIYLTLAAIPFTQGPEGHAGHGVGANAFPLDFAAPFGTTSFAWAMRMALVGTGAAFLLATGRYFFADARRRESAPDRRAASAQPASGRWSAASLIAVAALAGAALAGSSIAGHAAAIGGPIFGFFDWLHLAGVGVWLGTLPGLLLLALWTRGRPQRGQLIGGALRRHSRIALVAAPIVGLTGVANSPIVLGSSRELVASDYGNLVIAKALLFSLAIAIGSANFFLVKRGSFRRVLALVGAEVGVATLAVVAAAAMVTIQPSASRLPVLTQSSVDSLHLYGQAGDNTVHAAVSVPTPGVQTYQVSVGDAATGEYRTDVQKVILGFDPPAGSNLPPERVDLEQQPDGRLWEATGAYTPIVGDWKLEVTVRRTGMLDVSTTFDMPVVKPLPPRKVPPPDTGIDTPPPLAVLWMLLPTGALGWAVPVILLLAFLASSVLARRARKSPLRVLRAGLVVLAVITGIGVGSREAVEAANRPPPAVGAVANPIPADAASITRGRNVYLANCSNCHGSDGDGNGPTAAGLLPPPGPIGPAVRRTSENGLFYIVTNGVASTSMPSFASTLSENDRWDLVNYLRSEYAGPDTASPDGAALP